MKYDFDTKGRLKAMKMTFRWYGKDDPVKLKYIAQIPGMHGIVSAIYDIPVGEVWPIEKIKALKTEVEGYGLELSVIESVPVHEAIKLGQSSRDRYIENYKKTLKHLGMCGIHTVCYNFMPVFDWTRSNIHYQLEDGSYTLIFNQKEIEQMDPMQGDLSLPGWDTSYEKEEMHYLIQQYQALGEERLWENLIYFLKAIMPVCEQYDVKMAIHPDDPPWTLFGIPRIIKDYESLERLITSVDSPYNGITLCVGSLGCRKENDLIHMIEVFGKEKKRIHFTHLRNIKRKDDGSFKEIGHLSSQGSIDFYEIVKAYVDYGFEGYYRPDHGRMIWGEVGRAGYGLYDRALGATYINGLIEAVVKQRNK